MDKAGDLKKNKALLDLKLKDFMRYPPILIREDDEFHMVEKILREAKIKHLPVVNDQGHLVGLITLSDLYRTCSPKKNVEDGTYCYEKDALNRFILKYVMTANPVTMGVDNTLMEALNLMVEGTFGCVPVVDQNHMLVGIVTQTDMLRTIARLLKEM